MMEKDKAFEILEKGLKSSEAEQTELLLMGEKFSFTQLVENVIRQNISRLDHTVMARMARFVVPGSTHHVTQCALRAPARSLCPAGRARHAREGPHIVS